MAAALLLLLRRRRLRALGGRRRRPLSLTERRGAGTRGAMAGGRRGAMTRPEQSSAAHRPAITSPHTRALPGGLRGGTPTPPQPTPRAPPPTRNPRRPLLHRSHPRSTHRVWNRRKLPNGFGTRGAAASRKVSRESVMKSHERQRAARTLEVTSYLTGLTAARGGRRVEA